MYYGYEKMTFSHVSLFSHLVFFLVCSPSLQIYTNKLIQ